MNDVDVLTVQKKDMIRGCASFVADLLLAQPEWKSSVGVGSHQRLAASTHPAGGIEFNEYEGILISIGFCRVL